ncbi:pyruvate kinase [uncultured Megasphaera sp.]|uniref:pyruvate kinase n=1 Tax=uncultured Megasphaera sp. TaxID=165188 RepID=UPI0026DEE6A3|nr:pyruvate kinase [uncultured Megasphaera sp.]
MEQDIYPSAKELYSVLCRLRKDVLSRGDSLYRQWKPLIQRRHFTYSAWNLAFYLALRCHDLRKIQRSLLPFGLSSLGRGEARAITNLDAVMASLGRICQEPEQNLVPYPQQRRFFYGDGLLAYNTGRIFGTAKTGTRIMVTLPTEAAEDNGILIRDLVAAGMDCARINCAHDSKELWGTMISYIHRAEQETGNHCKVYMDLAGPKVRIESVLLRYGEARVMPGEQIFLVSGSISTYPEEYKGNIVISCSIPEIFEHMEAGHPVLIDDGKIRAIVEKVTPEGAYLTITYTKPLGGKIKNEKSLNFPQTPVELSPLTDKDKEDLDFVVQYADAIGYSFVKSAADVSLLQKELQQRCGKAYRQIALVAKLENKEAVDNLPEIIVQAASKQPLGIMIARGDLAVEVGYRRLAELQEEIMWICEAAHVPVIWATQVLENLVKKGLPSRAEITDAAMGERAECVMLNKGPYIVEAVTALTNILLRMEQHQHKKTSQLRALHIAQHMFENGKS